MNLLHLLSRRVFDVSRVILPALILTLTIFGAGEVDPTFNGGAFQTSYEAYTIARQPDGKILFGGYFLVVNGLPRQSLVRVSGETGAVDQTFNASAVQGEIRAIVLLSDGKIVIGGNLRINDVRVYAVRLNSDGSLDPTFQLFPANGGSVFDLEVMNNGKIVIAGNLFYSASGNARLNVARFNADGSDDASFNPPFTGNSLYIEDIEVQSDGKIIGATIMTGTTTRVLKRYNTDGSEDNSFNVTFTGSMLRALRIQPDGKILIAGSFSHVNGVAKSKIARLNADGTVDNTFDAASANALLPDILDVEIDSNGKIVLTGYTPNNPTSRIVVRLESNGALDSSFNFNPVPPITSSYDILPLPDGKILLASGSTPRRINADGTIDTSFAVLLGQFGSVNEIVVQTDGKVLVAGGIYGIGAVGFNAMNTVIRPNVGRFNIDGTTDTTFNVSITPANSIITGLAVQPDGKILLGGLFNGRFIRLNPDGSRDTTFNIPASVNGPDAIEVLPNGQILAAGGRMQLLNADGSLDPSFMTVTLNGYIEDLLVQPDGKILIGGSFTTINGTPRVKVARLNQNGSLDTTFNPTGNSNQVFDMALQADGKIIIGGNFIDTNGANRSYLARLNSDGTTDTTYNPNLNGAVNAVRIQPDGKLIIGGAFTTVNGAARNRLARLNADGSLDTAFQIGTGATIPVNNVLTNPAVFALALESNGKILVGGYFSNFNGAGKTSIVRLLNDSAGRTRFDFDGDGRADLGVFRPSNGFWYLLNIQNNAFSARQFGAASDLIAPADYDGDGKTDIAVFRPGAFAYFYIFDSSTNAFRFAQFGTTGDVPMSGDWDGDGRGDLAVYRAATATGGQSNFYYRPSSQPAVDYVTIAFGTAGDKPLYGDFDGDGRLDAAVFRASDASWRILQSSNNQTVQTTFGVATDIPVPADYDGDGRANIAVFRPSNGTWYTSPNPATNYGAIQFGANGDLPVPADYDGDGRADTAVFRPSNGAWYLNRTTSGFAGVQFGANGDKPAPNAFIR